MNKKLIIMIGLLLVVGSFGVYSMEFQEVKHENNLIRFHVLANSDSPEDQQLKLLVRDRIMVEMADTLEGVTSIAESKRVINENIDVIQAIAKDEVEKWGWDYEVEVILGQHIFPTRKYGNVIFPAGQYEALRVIIGDGQGQNWWCVMFPPLCFVDVRNGLVDNKTQQELTLAMAEDGQKFDSEAFNQQEISLQLRSKIVDFVRNSKNQIDRLASD